MKPILLIFFTLTVVNSHAQAIFAGWGPATLLTNQSVRMLNSKNDFSLSGMQQTIGGEYRYN